MKKISEMNISSKMKVKLVNMGIQESRRNHIKTLVIDDPDSYLELRRSQIEYAKKFKKDHPDYDKKWRKKNPKKYKNYTLKRRKSRE
ncbi:hypothetical protein ES695_14905 [Candidatus Atribacteria bacterium 1244-E10-H5-B2]|nr:MAG: hypothetical protein ES695_14905 [Candidatus Atribacteria bacterium 1244-E10-H5-B2]